MAVRLIRYVAEGSTYWGRVDGDDDVTALDDDYPTTGALLESGRLEWVAAEGRHPTHFLSEVAVTSPLTTPCRVICHDVDRKTDPARHDFFPKADASVTGPYDPVTRPRHVRRLDHGVRLGLVIGTSITGPVGITDDELPRYVAAVTIGNGLWTRDIQHRRGRLMEAHSLRGSFPVGPELVVLDADEFTVLHDLTLEVHVNGRLRQTGAAADVLVSPARALTELSRFCDLSPGDVVFTTTPTPHGAGRSPRALFARFTDAALPHRETGRERTRRHGCGDFLRPGDIVRASIRTPDGAIDLGGQRTPIVDGGPVG